MNKTITKAHVQSVLDSAQALPMNEALSYLTNELYDENEIAWEHFDTMLEMYKENRASLTAEYICVNFLLGCGESEELKNSWVD
ncbi:hypothetical protein L2744_02940 [Shewanella profunda]|uniref:hypothetical protein n=1 Tax=Shewanella profunda TaxID=254793 RepID=UPI00200E7FC1|nr:hypothetical protein [Shewanella profunda]MCL1088586.1 hypothetical protein [Shewanella profunda]